MVFIKRDLSDEIIRLNKSFSVLTVTGPRQSGKTTLCKHLFPQYFYLNLEDIRNREAVQTDPYTFLEQYSNGIIIDEAHYLPEIFSVIQVLVDNKPESRFILTGSSNFSLLQKITQSLAGRAAILTLLPLSLKELSQQTDTDTDTLLLKGGYPSVWNGSKLPIDVYRNYYNTYIERDIRQLINIKDITQFQMFMKLCAGRTGTEFNASAFAAEIGVTVKTIQSWLNVLSASYVLFRLPPFYRNIGKRIIKNHKLYFYDTGLVCFLLGIENKEMLSNYPTRGAIFENMIVADFLKRRYNEGKEPNVYFYRDNFQKEIDIIQECGFDNLYAYEVKSAKSYNSEFNAGLNYFVKLFGEKVKSTKVIYDGSLELNSNKNGYLNFRSL